MSGRLSQGNINVLDTELIKWKNGLNLDQKKHCNNVTINAASEQRNSVVCHE